MIRSTQFCYDVVVLHNRLRLGRRNLVRTDAESSAVGFSDEVRAIHALDTRDILNEYQARTDG